MHIMRTKIFKHSTGVDFSPTPLHKITSGCRTQGSLQLQGASLLKQGIYIHVHVFV